MNPLKKDRYSYFRGLPSIVSLPINFALFFLLIGYLLASYLNLLMVFFVPDFSFSITNNVTTNNLTKPANFKDFS